MDVEVNGRTLKRCLDQRAETPKLLSLADVLRHKWEAEPCRPGKVEIVPHGEARRWRHVRAVRIKWHLPPGVVVDSGFAVDVEARKLGEEVSATLTDVFGEALRQKVNGHTSSPGLKVFGYSLAEEEGHRAAEGEAAAGWQQTEDLAPAPGLEGGFRPPPGLEDLAPGFVVRLQGLIGDLESENRRLQLLVQKAEEKEQDTVLRLEEQHRVELRSCWLEARMQGRAACTADLLASAKEREED